VDRLGSLLVLDRRHRGSFNVVLSLSQSYKSASQYGCRVMDVVTEGQWLGVVALGAKDRVRRVLSGAEGRTMVDSSAAGPTGRSERPLRRSTEGGGVREEGEQARVGGEGVG
jgi:hypothetical protein